MLGKYGPKKTNIFRMNHKPYKAITKRSQLKLRNVLNLNYETFSTQITKRSQLKLRNVLNLNYETFST